MGAYNNLQDIIKRINELMEQLSSSTLSNGELEELEILSRLLYERSVILHYKAKEEHVYQKKAKKSPTPPEEKAPESKKESISSATQEPPQDAGEIHFDFSGDLSSTNKVEKTPPKKKPKEAEFQTSSTNSKEDQEESTTPNKEGKEITFYNYFVASFQKGAKDKLSTARITSIKGTIGLNDRMQFINELFNGDVNLFNEMVESLDQLENMESALQKLSQVAAQQEWEKEIPSVDEFAHLINRRYVE